ncbi:sigma-54 interaction domain-containing protein [Abyssisolibacter fermentans]|uniref:sigma-54 interaction domain-containing protein n=1 Tax=Abyssisolibacter fermentans TaxID=1766203 RepID=UPI000830A783|nr:sigma 54-interacting transcriptional regulator [Abyssisolibacter fermentans]
MENIDINLEEFVNIIDNLYDEIVIWDNNYKLVYINYPCLRHYGVHRDEIIGKKYYEIIDREYWNPQMLPYVYDEKVSVIQKQKLSMGSESVTIATPIFDRNGELKYVAMIGRDYINNINHYNPIEIEKSKKEYSQDNESEIIYKSEKMKDIINIANKISKVSSPCLIMGETGTGKTMLARYMHKKSNRNNKLFVDINCASFSKELIESELFGYKKGAFTGARSEGKKGLIEIANGGTLFLDEIFELPLDLQAKLLHVIQEKRFLPVGGTEKIEVDIKIIAATNCDLKKMVEAGRFREDLFYRLNVFEILIPPLRERKTDITLLTSYFLNYFNNKYDTIHEISEETFAIVNNYSWPGNTRELSHIIERLVVIVDELIIKPCHLPKHLFELKKNSNINLEFNSLKEIIENYEEKVVKDLYQRNSSSRKLAERLKISQSKANNLIQKYIEK